jgi:CPA1 family monovalent cation:H+ antiporter
MSLYEVFTIIICLGALFSYINTRFLKWTPTIGIMALSMLFSLLVAITAKLLPGFSGYLISIITAVDFHHLLMDSMLAFLLFAGSIHIDAQSLKKERLPILALATAGIFISTFLVGTAIFYIFPLFAVHIEYIYCLLFAALISPTDPIAVLAILKRAGLSKTLELKIAGESLFNDGVAVVVFLTILNVAQAGTDHLSAMDVSMLFMRQAGGGLLFGLLLGYLSYRAIRSIDRYEVEVLITVATVMGGYLLANELGTSGPLAMVVAGIIIGNKSRHGAISDISKDYLNKFWELVDEMLNALLFMLIGLEMLVVKFEGPVLTIGLVVVLIVLLARWISVALPVLLLKTRIKFVRHAIAILTWGGLRGGLSVALALSLPASMHRDGFVAITYMVVVFSIIVQGLTISKLYKKLSGSPAI